MRKYFVMAITLALLSGGCSLFGSSADPILEEETVTQTVTPEATTTTAAVAEVSGSKAEAQVKAELDQMGKKLASQAARTRIPSAKNKEVRQVGNEYVATYIVVNSERVSTQLRPSSVSGKEYVGIISYSEDIMECRGKTRQEALSAPCNRVGTRNLREMIRYDGKKWLD